MFACCFMTGPLKSAQTQKFYRCFQKICFWVIFKHVFPQILDRKKIIAYLSTTNQVVSLSTAKQLFSKDGQMSADTEGSQEPIKLT